MTSKNVFDMQGTVEATIRTALEKEGKTLEQINTEITNIRQNLATFEPAYVTVDSCDVTYDGVGDYTGTKTLMAGYTMSEREKES